MKDLWDNYFFDLEDGNLNKEEFAQKLGELISAQLLVIKQDIENLEPKKAIKHINILIEDI